MGERIAEHDAEKRDHSRDPERPQPHRLEQSPLLRNFDQAAIVIDREIERREQIDGSERRGRTPDREPGLALSPARVDCDQRRTGRRPGLGCRSDARGARDQRLEPGLLDVEAVGEDRDAARGLRVTQIGVERGEDGFAGNAIATPIGNRGCGPRQYHRDRAIIDAAQQNQADGQHEIDHEEQQQRRDQQHRQRLAPPLCAAKHRLQTCRERLGSSDAGARGTHAALNTRQSSGRQPTWIEAPSSRRDPIRESAILTTISACADSRNRARMWSP